MATQAGPPNATDSQLRYHSAYCGIVKDKDGKFEHFVRKTDASHSENGYWRFTTALDEKRAYSLGHYTPEEILSAVHHGDGTYNDIQLRWVPGRIDPNAVGALSGNAAQHLQNIHEARRFLGKAMAIPGNVPLYPVEPRMKGYWDAKRAGVRTSSMIVGGSKAFVSPLPSSRSSRLSSLERGATVGRLQAPHLGSDRGSDHDSPPAAFTSSPATGLRSRNSTAPSQSPTATPSRLAEPQSPGNFSASQHLSRSAHNASAQHSSPAGSVAQYPRDAMDLSSQGSTASASNSTGQQERLKDRSEGLGGQTGLIDSLTATPKRSGQPAYAVSFSQSRDAVVPPRDLNNNRYQQGRPSTGPERPDVMAGHLAMVPASSSLTHRSRTPPTSSLTPYLPLADAFNILGLSPSLESSHTPPQQPFETHQPQFLVAKDIPQSPWETHDMVCDDQRPVEPEQIPGAKILHVATSADMDGELSGLNTSSQEAADQSQTATEMSETTQVDPLQRGLIADCNDHNENKRPKNDGSSFASADATSQSQPVIRDMYPGLACMDCGEETVHTMGCYIGNLQPMENLTILHYRHLAESVERFDPGPWTTHQGPPREPESETAEEQIQGMAEVIRDEDSYKNDPLLQALPDEAMILLWAFKTSPNVELVDEFGASESDWLNE